MKAYPQLGRKVGESVCVAGIDVERSEWIRLNPLDFRSLPKERQFAKYQVINVDVVKTPTDGRPESFTPRNDTIEPIGRPLPAGTSNARRAIVLPLERESMCAVIREQRDRGTSLAVFRQEDPPEIVTEPQDSEWEPSRQLLAGQQTLLGPTRTPLEKLPYRFSFRYRCSDSACKAHEQMSVDWEIGEAFRDFRHRYGDEGALDQIRDVWSRMWTPDREPYLYIGSLARYPESFINLGVFRPLRSRDAGSRAPEQGELPLPQ